MHENLTYTPLVDILHRKFKRNLCDQVVCFSQILSQMHEKWLLASIIRSSGDLLASFKKVLHSETWVILEKMLYALILHFIPVNWPFLP